MEANTDEKMAIVADWLAQLVWGSLSIIYIRTYIHETTALPHNISLLDIKLTAFQ